MTEPSGKGKVPHSEWTKITARRASGESFAQIARDYACSPPAIRYIVNRTKLKARTGAAVDASVRGVAPVSEMPMAARFDDALHQRVSSAIAAFLAAFDTSLDEKSPRSFDRLLEATDMLMRAAARTRIELERLRNTPGPRC
jgi:hypothetical protein